MTPQERQLVDDLFDRLAKVDNAPRDPDAGAAIAQGLRKAPNAIYALVQTVLLQDEALKRANGRIQELEQQASAPQQSQSGGFLDSMRETIFGQSSQPRGSVPNVPPPASRPVWNSGQVLNSGQALQQGQYGQQPGGSSQQPYGQPSYGGYGQSYGAPLSGGGGSFLGTAAAAAAGVVGGSLLLGGIRSMMGASHQGFGDTVIVDRDGAASPSSPWSDESNSSLARDAGIDDIGGSGNRADDNSRAGLLDQGDDQGPDNLASNFSDDDRDDMDLDSDNFGNDGGSDYA
ncbi:DUF2076 domain-containing protein [Bradyrhizobium sp.]|uniref:DUF2076 domain-containing protein n=1 Tax=Bradyrhizobium sp. TaxID=376 RepID=UPI003C59A864